MFVSRKLYFLSQKHGKLKLSLFTLCLLSFQVKSNFASNLESFDVGYCAPYNGKICKSYITTQVWYSREDKSGGWLNEKITTGLFDELMEDLPPNCRWAAEKMVNSSNNL
jgi:hypothetical protein